MIPALFCRGYISAGRRIEIFFSKIVNKNENLQQDIDTGSNFDAPNFFLLWRILRPEVFKSPK